MFYATLNYPCSKLPLSDERPLTLFLSPVMLPDLSISGMFFFLNFECSASTVFNYWSNGIIVCWKIENRTVEIWGERDTPECWQRNAGPWSICWVFPDPTAVPLAEDHLNPGGSVQIAKNIFLWYISKLIAKATSGNWEFLEALRTEYWWRTFSHKI